VGDVMAGLRLLRDRPVSLELYAGARAIYFDVEIEGPEDRASADKWLAAFIGGVHVPIELSPRWTLELRGYLKLPTAAWRATGLIEAEVASHATLQLGYQYAQIKHDEDVVSIDVKAHGPYLGVAFDW
jgi:hypothetical protein